MRHIAVQTRLAGDRRKKKNRARDVCRRLDLLFVLPWNYRKEIFKVNMGTCLCKSCWGRLSSTLPDGVCTPPASKVDQVLGSVGCNYDSLQVLGANIVC